MAETDYPIDPKTGRIDVPCFPPNTPGNPSREVMRLGMVGGRRADTDPTVAPISDVNNFVMLPDGSGMRVRDGFAFTDRYAIQTSPVGRQALMVETAPWNIPISFRHMILPTANGIPYVSEAEYIRDRSQALDSGSLSIVYFSPLSLNVSTPGGGDIASYLKRTGNASITSTVRYRSFGGTAVPGVDYTSFSGTATFNAGTIGTEDVFLGTINASGIGKYFFIELFSPNQGTEIGSSPETTDDPPRPATGPILFCYIQS